MGNFKIYKLKTRLKEYSKDGKQFRLQNTNKYVIFFYVYGSVHHNIFYEITNRCSYKQSILFHC